MLVLVKHEENIIGRGDGTVITDKIDKEYAQHSPETLYDQE